MVIGSDADVNVNEDVLSSSSYPIFGYLGHLQPTVVPAIILAPEHDVTIT